MSRLVARRRTVWVIVVAVVVSGAAPALAGTSSPRPALVRSPSKVRFRHSATIKVHLLNGTKGDKVHLQRRIVRQDFSPVATEPVNANSNVWFHLDDLRRTAVYRAAYKDPNTGDRTFSGTDKIVVKPKLTMHLSSKNVFVHHRLRIRGHLYPHHRGRRVVVQRRRSGRWHTIARPRVRHGDYSTGWYPKSHGKRRLRVRFRGDRINGSSRVMHRVRVFEKDPATWYGPGFYGHRTACGRRLTRHTVGVAHRHLPCGTDVSFMYHGKVITVPVIDRGPYSRADWDLTRAAARKLRFWGSDNVGTTR